MEIQKIYIKNMVCQRCIIAVRQTLENNKIKIIGVELGIVEIEKINDDLQRTVAIQLAEIGLELVEERSDCLVERIKVECRNYLENMESQLLMTKLSEYLSANIGKNYAYLSRSFSTAEGRTIENYFLQLKIERVRELLLDRIYSLGDISILLKYSSVHYLSSQFKKIQGCTVSEFLGNRQLA